MNPVNKILGKGLRTDRGLNRELKFEDRQFSFVDDEGSIIKAYGYEILKIRGRQWWKKFRFTDNDINMLRKLQVGENVVFDRPGASDSRNWDLYGPQVERIR